MSGNSSEDGADPIGEIAKSVGVLAQVMEIAEKSPELKAAGTNLAKTAQTVTALVNNCLLPIAAVNFAFEKGRRYFEERFQADLQAATEKIPADKILEPKAFLAAPILQGLTFCHEEEQLRAMYLGLLSSSMDSRTESLAHPAFVEVIKQVGAFEAGLLRSVLILNTLLPIVQIRRLAQAGGYTVLENHILAWREDVSRDSKVISGAAAMVDNWIRLGLVAVSYAEHVAGPTAYDWVSLRPEFISLQNANSGGPVTFQKGTLRLTAFGNQFRQIVLKN